MHALWGEIRARLKKAERIMFGGPRVYVSPGGWLGRSTRGRDRPKVRPAHRAQSFPFEKAKILSTGSLQQIRTISLPSDSNPTTRVASVV